MKPRTLTALLASLVAVVVLLVTIRSQVPIGAGIYYDDGAYLGLARSLANGDGYTYSNLPESVPGVKYPPIYPAVLAAMWKVFGVYPENLSILKALNSLFWALAAGGAFLLFARGGARRRAAIAAVTAYAFLTVPSMSIATVLMAEPLFLLVSVGALRMAGMEWGRRAPPEPPSDVDRSRPEWGRSFRSGTATHAAALGALGALAFLTRSIGVTLIAALLIPILLDGRWKTAGVVAVAAGVPSFAWLAWQHIRAAQVPQAIAGQYGSYGAWVSQGLEGGTIGRLREIVTANWAPFVETLQFVWVPRATGWALFLVLAIVGAAIVTGLPRIWRRNPALALFPFVYLAMVFVWPYQPYRFYYAIVPLLTLLAFEGLWEAVPRIRDDLPRWGLPVGVIVALAFVANALLYHGRGHSFKSWASPQTIPARAYAPLNDWIHEHTSKDAVIASALDPYVYWETGRPAVPSWRFLADDYQHHERTPEVLAAALDTIIVRYDARYVALILGENKAARTLEAFVQLHPERAEKMVETSGPMVGVIYALSPPGTALGIPEAVEDAPPDTGESDRGAEPNGGS